MSGWLTLLYVATALGQVMLNLSLGPDMYTIHRRRNIGELLPLYARQLSLVVSNYVVIHHPYSH